MRLRRETPGVPTRSKVDAAAALVNAIVAAQQFFAAAKPGILAGVVLPSRLVAVLLGLSLLACGAGDRPPAPRAIAAVMPPPASVAAPIDPAPPSPAPAPAAEVAIGPDLRAEDAERVLFLATDLRTDAVRRVCPASLATEPRIRCLLALRYEDEPPSRELALTLYAETGNLAGLLPEETSDDGRGGKVHLLPARPIGANREQLGWILDAFRGYRRFLTQLAALGPVTFRDRPVDLRFFYSESKQAPSAFAVQKNLGYNLYGVVNISAEAVRDTLFHEVFHLNDGWREGWSARALAPIHARIVARCGKKSACLAPYSPTETMMDGAYYAFAGRGAAREYAAELALRYYRESRAILEGKPLPARPFKCGPAENKEAWRLLVREFFGGVDPVPECPPGF
jgi:hypothetical protein